MRFQKNDPSPLLWGSHLLIHISAWKTTFALKKRCLLAKKRCSTEQNHVCLTKTTCMHEKPNVCRQKKTGGKRAVSMCFMSVCVCVSFVCRVCVDTSFSMMGGFPRTGLTQKPVFVRSSVRPPVRTSFIWDALCGTIMGSWNFVDYLRNTQQSNRAQLLPTFGPGFKKLLRVHSGLIWPVLDGYGLH